MCSLIDVTFLCFVILSILSVFCFLFLSFVFSLCLCLRRRLFSVYVFLVCCCSCSTYFHAMFSLFHLPLALYFSLPLSHSLSHPLSYLCACVCVCLCGNHLLIKQDPGDQLNHHPDDLATLAASNWHRAMRPTPAWPLTPSRSWTGAWISWRPYKHIAVSPTWLR